MPAVCCPSRRGTTKLRAEGSYDLLNTSKTLQARSSSEQVSVPATESLRSQPSYAAPTLRSCAVKSHPRQKQQTALGCLPLASAIAEIFFTEDRKMPLGGIKKGKRIKKRRACFKQRGVEAESLCFNRSHCSAHGDYKPLPAPAKTSFPNNLKPIVNLWAL